MPPTDRVSSPEPVFPETHSAGVALKASDVQHVLDQNKALLLLLNQGRGGVGPLSSSGVPAFLSFVPPLPPGPKPSPETLELHQQALARQQAMASQQRLAEFPPTDWPRDPREWLDPGVQSSQSFYPGEWRHPMDPLLVQSLLQSQAMIQGQFASVRPPFDHPMRGQSFPSAGLASSGSRAPHAQGGDHGGGSQQQRAPEQGEAQKGSERVSNAEKLKRMMERKKREQLEKKQAESNADHMD